MADGEEVKGKRDLFIARMREKYPDKEYDDDEALFGQINDDYDNYDNELNSMREREQVLTDSFTNDPRSAQFFVDMSKGRDPYVMIIERVGIDGMKEILNDPKKLKDFEDANQQYLERVAKNKELEKQWEENYVKTLDMLSQKQEELGLTDEQIDKVSLCVQGIINDGLLGIITPETFDLAVKALNYDEDVKNASEEGEIRGKNYKAEAMLRKPKQGDGMTHLSGANNTPSAKRGGNSIFDLADGAK